MLTLILVRHGPSAHVAPAGLLDRAAVLAWRAQYDAAGIVPAAAPPAELVTRLQRVDQVITSDMARARESAERVCQGQRIVVTPFLRETALHVPRWPTPLPLGAWGALIYAGWKAGAWLGSPLDECEVHRVGRAARLATEGLTPPVSRAVITHGVFRALLTAELQRAGWRLTGRRGGYAHWSAWTLESRG